MKRKQIKREARKFKYIWKKTLNETLTRKKGTFLNGKRKEDLREETKKSCVKVSSEQQENLNTHKINRDCVIQKKKDLAQIIAEIRNESEEDKEK